jgi:manganese/zinc/iron transport system ATP- binding protein
MTTSTETPSTAVRTDALVLEGVSVAYGRRLILKDVSAEIERGQVVGVIGPNGGGKSTLLKAVAGVIPVLDGTISLFGRPAAQMRNQMAYVPQREAVDWDFPVTVLDVVLMGRFPRTRWPHRNGRYDREIAMTMLERVGMAELHASQIGHLSGGQQQRVFIARALAQDADVLLLDEPMTGIDASTQEVVLAIIEQQRQADKIVLLASHDLVSASGTCDCLFCVSERMVSYGATVDMYTAENLSQTFGGPVIVLGPQSGAVNDGAHHVHQHENLGREHGHDHH